MKQKKIVVLGAGAMGGAFCFPAADNGHDVRLVGTFLDDELIDQAAVTGVHPRAGVPFPEGVRVHRYGELPDVMSSPSDLVVLGVSSAGIEWAVKELAVVLKRPAPIALLTKGLDAKRGSLRVFTETVRDALAEVSVEPTALLGVAGPCIAAELAARRPTSVVLGCADPSTAAQVRELLETDYYRVELTEDVTGIEACAALKNFYALAVGAATGWLDRRGTAPNGAGMHNPAASIFSRALAEMEYLVTGMGGKATSVYGLAGAGDLYVTCQAGRNSRMGRLLGSGMRYSLAKTERMPHDTVEGAELALAIGSIVERELKSNVLEKARLPLAAAILRAVCHDAPFELSWETLSR